MNTALDKGNSTKVRELKKVKGYVAPTDTGTIRTVRTHLKPVDVNVKTDVADPKLTEEPNQPLHETANKIKDLNNKVRNASFDGNTSSISKAINEFYRAGISASSHPRLDESDGIRKIYDEMSGILNNMGFNNKYGINSKDAMIKLTDPNYVNSLVNKVNTLESRLKELGFTYSRKDAFTISLDDYEGKNIFISNNPLDILTSQNMGRKLNNSNINVLSSLNQDIMNDFVFYTASSTRNGIKNAVGVATYDPKTKTFQHHSESVARGNDGNGVSAINTLVKETLQSQRSKSKSLADIEVYEIKAMITEKLNAEQSEIEKEVKGEKSPTGFRDPNQYIDIIFESLKKFNTEFEELVASGKGTSMALNSPLHHKMLQIEKGKNQAMKVVQNALDTFSSAKKKKSKLRGI